MIEKTYHFGQHPYDLSKLKEIIQEIKNARENLREIIEKPQEFFEPSGKLLLDCRETDIKKIKYLNQTSLMHALLLKHEFYLKLAATVDAYLIAIENHHPLMIYLSARYIIELLATINYLVTESNKIMEVDLKDWEGRGRRFLINLVRGRYSSSDPMIKSLFRSAGMSKSSLDPIGITDAIKNLSNHEIGGNIKETYDFLSNFCHHNGSTHQLFHKSMRSTNMITLQTGLKISLAKPAVAVTLSYPSDTVYMSSFNQTADLVRACFAWCLDNLSKIAVLPFSDADVYEITKGEYENSFTYVSPAYAALKYKQIDNKSKTLGRNSICSCGSGLKYKKCCGHYNS